MLFLEVLGSNSSKDEREVALGKKRVCGLDCVRDNDVERDSRRWSVRV